MAFATSWCDYQEDFPNGFSIDDKIGIYDHRVQGWLIHPVRLILNGGQHHNSKWPHLTKDGESSERPDLPAIPHSGFVALQMMFSYFESFAKYRKGYTSTHPSKSRKFFVLGCKHIFDFVDSEQKELDDCLKYLYRAGRCGLYHGIAVGRGVVIGSYDGSPIIFDGKTKVVLINPHLWPDCLERAHCTYVEELRKHENEELRNNFESRYDFEQS